MRSRITTSAFHIFGSGSASAKLCLAETGERVIGDDKEFTENSFVGFSSTVVNLPPETPITYYRGTTPGSSVWFEGTWGELLHQQNFKLVQNLQAAS